jgi:hypothetical protein
MLWYLTTSDHQLYNVTPLKTPFGLLIRLLQSHTHNYNHTIISYAVSHLHSLQFYTFTLADFSASKYYLKLSHTLHLHTSRVCLLLRPHSWNNYLTTDFLDLPVPLV